MVQKKSIRDVSKRLIQWVYACAITILILAHSSFASAATHLSKTTIGELVGNEPTILNWKTNEIIIPFDLPGTVWVDKVELLISAQPTGELRHRRNLELRINDSDPIIFKAQGQRFDARVKLAQKHLRRTGNRLYLSGISTSSACAGPNHAGWEISKDRSMVVFYGRERARDLSLRDLANLWRQPGSKPSTLGLKVVGADKFRHEALLTQAMTLRSDKIPQLRTAFAGNDVDIVVGLKSDVKPFTRRDIGPIGSSTNRGAQIILDKGRPPRIILTGDTPAQVRQSVNAFSKHKLPITRRVQISPIEMSFQPAISNQRVSFEKTHKLADAGSLRPANKWITPPLNFNFDTTYAAQKTGKLILRLNGSESLSADSSLSIALNDRPLGKTQIDALRKTVRLDIPAGYLVGANNKIVMTPDLRPSDSINVCDVAKTPAGFSLGLGSKITIDGDVDTNIHDVSNIAAWNGPFAFSKKVVIYSTATRETDRLATLRLMGHIAHISRAVWTHAEFMDGDVSTLPETDNILVVGPSTNSLDPLLTHAPKALRLALSGQKIPHIPEEQVASVLRVAALDANEAFQLAATSARQQAKRFASGLISIYDDPSSTQTISLITTHPGGSFSSAVNNLIKPKIWNGLSGSVAQWDGQAAQMIQTSQPKLLTKSEPLHLDNINLESFVSLDWEAIGIIHDDMAESLYNVWEKPATLIGGKINDVTTALEKKWEELFAFNKYETRELINESPELAPQPSPVPGLETIPEPSSTPTPAAVKSGSASITPIPRVKPRAPSSANLPLRGRHGVNETTSQGPNALANVKSGAISAFNSVKTSAIKSYENFDLWVASVNSKRKAKGEAPIASSPALAILLLLCGALILLGLARPKQL